MENENSLFSSNLKFAFGISMSSVTNNLVISIFINNKILNTTNIWNQFFFILSMIKGRKETFLIILLVEIKNCNVKRR